MEKAKAELQQENERAIALERKTEIHQAALKSLWSNVGPAVEYARSVEGVVTRSLAELADATWGNRNYTWERAHWVELWRELKEKPTEMWWEVRHPDYHSGGVNIIKPRRFYRIWIKFDGEATATNFGLVMQGRVAVASGLISESRLRELLIEAFVAGPEYAEDGAEYPTYPASW